MENLSSRPGDFGRSSESMDPYSPPQTVASRSSQRVSLRRIAFAVFVAVLGYVAPFGLNALANVQRLGPMPVSDAFYGFGGWHWPPNVTAYLLLVPNVFAMITFGLATLLRNVLSMRMKRILVAAACFSLLLVYAYWIGFCFGYPTQPSRSQTVNNAIYAVFTVGLPSIAIVAFAGLGSANSDEQADEPECEKRPVANGSSTLRTRLS